MDKKQVKSKQRVAEHGEVFTANREVNAMLDLVKQETQRVDSRFLEPACGDGNFLAEILRRKLEAAKREATPRKRKTPLPYDFERKAVLAVSSIYGIDILLDNCEACRERLFKIWDSEYTAVCRKEISEDTRASVEYILSRNIICGNALSLMCVDGNGSDTEEPIVFSEWAFAVGDLIKRTDCTFDKALRDAQEQVKPDQVPTKKKKRKAAEPQQVSLLADAEEQPEDVSSTVREYAPVYYRKVWEYGK